MAATVSTRGGFSVSKPRLLFSEYMSGPPGMPNYDVAPDGQRFLMLKEAETAPDVTTMNVISNWPVNLKNPQ